MIGIAALALIAFLAGWYLKPAGLTDPSAQTNQTIDAQSADYYTCPMHPFVRSDKPGPCPVCGMAMVKKSTQKELSGGELKTLGSVSLSSTQRVAANISTVPVERRTLRKIISAVGVVDYAEPNFKHISTRFPGRLEKLYLNYTGQKVKTGDPVADVYSPDAISAQQEYLLALNLYESSRNADAATVKSSETLLDLSRQKLLRWGFVEKQLAALNRTRKVQDTITIYSPISGTVLKKNVDPQHYAAEGEDIYDVADLSIMWVYFDVYEQDLRYVSVGQEVRIKTEAYPGEIFMGKVAFIDPMLNAETRTVRVRAEFRNPDEKLKPNMYANAEIRNPIANALVVPASAVLSTGKRTVVWVEARPNMFEPRDVMVGSTTDGFAEITKGLKVGEHVASTGGFLLDSESALQQPMSADPHAGHGTKSKTGGTPEPQMKKSEHDGHVQSSTNQIDILVKGKYQPNVVRVKRGELVKLNFYRDEDSRCTDEVIFQGLSISRKLAAWKTTTVELTPTQAGEFRFTCGMNMVHGTLIVED